MMSSTARAVGTVIHSAPEEAGQVLALVKPRLAVVYHFFNDFDTGAEIEREIRKAYEGPLALAQDLMVFNVTQEDIRVRMAVTADACVAEQGAPRRGLAQSAAHQARAEDVALARRPAALPEVLAL